MTCSRKGKDGIEHLFRIDIDAINFRAHFGEAGARYESYVSGSHDGYSHHIGFVRVSALDRLAGFLGYRYADFVALGFTLQDLAEIYADCLRTDLGFPMPEDSGQGSASA